MVHDIVLIHSTGQGAAGWEAPGGRTCAGGLPPGLARGLGAGSGGELRRGHRPPRADAFHAAWIGKDPTEDDAVAAAFLYHDCDEATLEWALSTRRPFLPRGVYGQRLPLAPEIPSTDVVAAHDRTIRPEWQRRMARERLGVEPMEILSGHCPNVSQPDRLAGILVDLDCPFGFTHAGDG
jgi:pimeloyl-ACP methyl ester carboxylesterase